MTSSQLAEKLPFESEHKLALERMRMLSPYYRWVFNLLEPHMGGRVLDAGCGIGNFTQILADTQRYVVAVDLSPRNIEVLKGRFAGNSNVLVVHADLDNDIAEVKLAHVDTIVCLDVLEHVEDDVAALARFREIIEPGGTLLIKVPACPWLFGEIDVASSHFRRYTRKELETKAMQAGWKDIRTQYMNIAGVLPYWFKSCVLGRKSNFSRTFSERQLKILNRIIPLLERFDQIVGPPIGQSAIMIAR